MTFLRFTDKARRWISAHADQPDACGRVMSRAFRIARDGGAEAINLTHLKQAERELGQDRPGE